MEIKMDEERCWDCGREFVARPLHKNVQVGDRVYCPCPNNGSHQDLGTDEAPCNRYTMGTVVETTVRLRTEEGGEYLFDSPREAIEFFRGLTPEAGAGTVDLCTKERCECEPGAHSHWEQLFVLSPAAG